jgi:hypothetical protein
MVYFTLFIALYICNGLYVAKWAMLASDQTIYDTTLVNDVAYDWSKLPFTDLTVTASFTCPSDFPDVVFQRTFEGTQLGCDCLGIYSKWIDNSNQMIKGKACSVNQTIAYCTTVQPLPVVSQYRFNNQTICGRRGKTSFAN